WGCHRRCGKSLKAMDFWAGFGSWGWIPKRAISSRKSPKLTLQLGAGDTLRVSHKMLDNKA
ncbi:TPA: hypothetical protein ACXJEH_004269, partial [Pseudomonas aeruginosa]